jgi:5-methylcytosine-specific restriction endonuclease McrA
MPTIIRKEPKRPWAPERKAFGRMAVDNQQFYNSAKWRRFAKAEKMRYPLCDNFDTCGGTHDITDHPIPISEGGHPFNQQMNHLCFSCNASKTGKQAHHKQQ